MVVNFGKTKKKQKRKTTQNSVRSTVWFSFCQICLHSFIHSTHFYWALVPCTILGFVVVQSLRLVQLFATTWTAARQASLSITISWSLPKFMSIESVIPSSHHPLLPSFPFAFNLSAASFPVSQLFTSGGQSIGASASVLPMNIQGWFPLGLTGLISLLSKGLLRVFSSTTFWRHQFFNTQPFLWSNSHIHTWLLERP